MKLKYLSPNCYELQLANGNLVLFSYETPVAIQTKTGVYKSSTKYSKTTVKHINRWTDTTLTLNQQDIDALLRTEEFTA